MADQNVHNRKHRHHRARGSRARIAAHGLVVRFAPIKGVTPRKALDRKLWLPAHLDEFDIAETALHNEYDTLSGGHFSQPAMGGASARQFQTGTLNTLVMDFDPPWFVVRGQDPRDIRQAIEEMLRAKKPVHLLIYQRPQADRRPDLDAQVTLRQVTRTIRAGEADTRYLAVDISEWRDPHVGRRSSSRSRKHGEQLPTTHRLTATDTLASLAYKFYGTYALWRAIRDVNGIPHKFGQKTPLVQLPGPFKVGSKIKIPDYSQFPVSSIT